MAVQLANALYAVWLRISYIVQAALRSVGAAGGGWALLAVLRAIGCLAKFPWTDRPLPKILGFRCQLGVCQNLVPSLKLTAKAPQNTPKPKRKVASQPPVFRYYVSFRECNSGGKYSIPIFTIREPDMNFHCEPVFISSRGPNYQKLDHPKFGDIEIPTVTWYKYTPETNMAPENGWLEYFLVSFWGV